MKKLALIIAIFTSLMLTGCEGIFETEAEAQTVYDKTELSENTYYAKDSSKFVAVYLPSGNSKSRSIKKDLSRFLYEVDGDFAKIPYLYSGEIIAYQSSKVSSLDDVYLERYYDMGKSFGFYKAGYNSKGYIEFEFKNCIEGSSFYEALYNAPGNTIEIVSINNEPVQAAMLNEAGIIEGLESDAEYDIEYYCGTYYGTARVKADTKFLQSYEIFNIGSMNQTKNGYLSIEFPEDYKPGYYNINGKGLVFYTGQRKGYDVTTLDINEPYYDSIVGEMSAYAQQYVVSVGEKTLEVKITVEYNEKFAEDDVQDISVILCSPEGQIYDMELSDGSATCTLAEMIPGKWTINITPKDLIVGDIHVESSKTAQAATEETFEFVMAEDTSSIRFYVEMEGNKDGDYWAVITDENGEAHKLEVDNKNMYLHYTYDYISAGTYKLSVYHYTDTKIKEANFEKNVDDDLTEIITVTE